MKNEIIISSWSQRRLEEQGYRGLTGTELRRNRLGIRFAYFVCGSLVLTGLILRNQPLLLITNVIALLGILPPRHPIDYLYNYGVRYLAGRPSLPPRPNQGRFACSMATLMLAIINYAFYRGNFTVVYIVGAALLTSASLVSFVDLCIPSIIYNAILGTHVEAQKRDPQGQSDGTIQLQQEQKAG